MQEAAQAASSGSKDRARDIYRTASKNYPSNKEPWGKLAEDYFEAGNYGQAILAAQEVIQRDPADALATGVLAVSGLRVSTAALATLRQQQASLNGGTRTEAESMASTLRDMLGEPVLVPRPVAATTVTTVPAAVVRSRPPVRAAAAAASSASAPPAVKSAAALPKPAAPDNPFNVLKK